MPDIRYAKNPRRKTLERITAPSVKTTIKELGNLKFVCVHENTVVCSATNGYLLGETVSDVIKKEDFIYLSNTKDGSVAIVVVVQNEIKLDTIASVDDWRFELKEALVSINDVEYFVTESLSEPLNLLIGGSSVSNFTIIDDDHFEKLAIRSVYRLITVKKYFSSGSELKPALIGAALLAVGGVVYLLQPKDVPPPVDNFAAYRQELAVTSVSDAISATTQAIIEVTSGLKLWVITGSETYADSVKLTVKPLMPSATLAEVKSFAQKMDIAFEASGDHVILIKQIQPGKLNTKTIFPLKDMAVEASDTITANTLFDVSFNVLTDKGNYITQDIAVNGVDMTIPELNFIRDVFSGWPVILDRITLTRSNKDVDFFYTVNIKARLIGGK